MCHSKPIEFESPIRALMICCIIFLANLSGPSDALPNPNSLQLNEQIYDAQLQQLQQQQQQQQQALAIPSSIQANSMASHGISQGQYPGSLPDYYQFRHVVAQAIRNAMKECRELYKWDRWNCPHEPFIRILQRDNLSANKEMAMIRALTAASIVLYMTRACGYGSGAACGCDASRIDFPKIKSPNDTIQGGSNFDTTTMGPPPPMPHTSNELDQDGFNKQMVLVRNKTDEDQVSAQFAWRGCEEGVHFAFDVSKMYLETQEQKEMDSTNKLINEHNYKAGRLAVKRLAKRICRCHGISGSCQISTCWVGMPSTRQVVEHLRRHHRAAIKVGASSSSETDSEELSKELNKTKLNKLVFVDPSPDYCYENTQHRINGTLGRYCIPTGKNNSCDRLCTKCGFGIKRETIQVERQCDCRFKYCCKVECKRCTRNEDVYRCAKHSH